MWIKAFQNGFFCLVLHVLGRQIQIACSYFSALSNLQLSETSLFFLQNVNENKVMFIEWIILVIDNSNKSFCI